MSSPFRQRLQDDLQAAMRARDGTRLTALRMLIAAIKNADIEARKELDDEQLLGVVQRQAKLRRESILEFRKGNRPDLVVKEEGELAVLETYLPAPATREEVEQAARAVIAETGASGPRDLGKVMPVLTRSFSGRADGRLINEVVRALLDG